MNATKHDENHARSRKKGVFAGMATPKYGETLRDT